MSTSEARKKSPLSSKTQTGVSTPPPPSPPRSPSRTKTRLPSKTQSPPRTSSFTFPTRTKAETSEECSVRVVVHVRPLIQSEIDDGCRECLKVPPKKTQGACGGSAASNLFGDYVQPLVDTLFKGYNATVLAYGQTGSGKTYTMGSAFIPEETARGVIPSVLDRIFERIKDKANVKCTVRASFVEIYKEEIRDLLACDGSRIGMYGASCINIREVASGGVCIAGATEREVDSKDKIGELLKLGAQVRATGPRGGKVAVLDVYGA